MQSGLFGLSIGMEFILLAGYLLYGILRQNSSIEDRYMISFYIVLLIAFITSVFTINSVLTLARFLPSEIPFVESFLYVNFILLALAAVDTARLRKPRNESVENDDA
jgi:hypothetical protein